MKWPSLYLPWLQKGNPTGTPDRLPQLTDTFVTSVPGVYCAGDLTGIPLIKLASESGYELVERLARDETFRLEREGLQDKSVYDLVIVGAGPAGVSACLRAAELGLRHVVLESSRPFNTIHNFPAGKPIYVTPAGPMQSDLEFSDGTKETLLQELQDDIRGKSLPVQTDEMVKQIRREEGRLAVETDKNTYRALRVIVAIGKTGNPRRLKAPGEDLPKVMTRLIDPTAHNDEQVLVVGGGDSALEAAAALARSGSRVTLSYRRAEFARPKEHNISAVRELEAAGKLRLEMASKLTEIREKEVVLETPGGEKTLPNDAVYGLIGSEIPTAFFKRSGIRMEGERDAAWWVFLAAMLSFFTMLYFGKSGSAVDIGAATSSWLGRAGAFLSAPFRTPLTWGLAGGGWYSSLNFVLGWLGTLVFLVSGPLALGVMVRRRADYFGSAWKRIKYTYLTVAAAVFTLVYFRSIFGQSAGWTEPPTYWYSLLYTTTIILFGIRRIQVRPTRYILAQTLTLMGIQTFFLFLLPFHLYEGVLLKWFNADSAVIKELFPSGKWSSFAYVLFWPLNINEFGNSRFWSVFPFVQTFGILFLIVWRWGKGAYCGWICSCGAMAETLGDEYRAQSPHGPLAKRLEHIGQFVLWFAVGAALLYVPLKFAAKGGGAPPTTLAVTTWHVYKLLIDVFFAGVLGLGVYFFLGGRIWCRYGCPLAALMHIYTRFSPYRIMANKKRCISCNICTKVCHMGIDVMGFANKGIPMNDAECVRCSACVVNCPMQVLTFGSVGRTDLDNVAYKERHIPPARSWTSGLSGADLEKLLKEEENRETKGE